MIKSKALLVTAMAGLMLSIVSYAAELNFQNKPTTQNKPLGKYVGLGDHRLYVYCTGSGSPTVIFESGIGGSSLEWFDIQQTLSDRVQTCAYDRGGYGMSDPGPSPRDTQQLVAEMRQLLIMRKIIGPYIIVGHSFGGYSALYHAKYYPEETAGLILIDSSHPRQSEVISPMLSGGKVINANNPINEMVENTSATDPLRRAAFLNRQRKAIFAQMDEIKNFQQSAGQIGDLKKVLNIPLTVMTRSPERDMNPADRQLEDNWLQLQKSLADISNKSRHIIVPNSEHNIHIGYPAKIVAVVTDMIDQVRSQQ